MSIFDPGKAGAFAKENARMTRVFLQSLTLEKSLRLGEMLIEANNEAILREFEYRRKSPLPVSISKAIERARNG